ncbi:LysR family transcriptional regulator [Sphingomonas sp. TDK1]|uniref:LysR family transcriptional regulator n=1 Tax=Sphingomonas sp. TDK1 TaxID=453247 RepID=UPI0007D95FE7|nr:LysR family transcriptional regulator [Sphingomonas sp. TDK1]OAN57068.1 LysR family transcriptional regulator [Sphingomonas sp. TDK1]
MFDPDYDLFLDIVGAESISAAARQRGLSPPALSKRLARLEQRLGTRLLQRTTRRLVLTSAGRELLETLSPIRFALAAAEGRIAGRHALVRGPLRVTAPTSFGRMHVVPTLPTFLAAYPDVDLSIDLSDSFVDLLGGGYDVAIRIAANAGAGLVGHRLGTSRRVLCASPAYLVAHGEPRTLAELAQHRLLATDSQLPWQLDGPDGPVSHQGQRVVGTNSSEVVRELAIAGCGIALRSLWDVSQALADGVLRRVLPDYAGSEGIGVFAVHAPDPPARVSALVEHLRRTIMLPP